MRVGKHDLLRAKGFAFFGAITASLSHQLNNVLATINELSGLIDDFLQAADAGRPLDPERLRKATRRIAGQVERGQDYVKRLNGFAHTVDEPRAAIEVRDALEALTLLCRRFATLRRAELELELGEARPVLEGGLFDLQHLLYRCLRMVIDAAQEGETVRLELAAAGDGARVEVTKSEPLGPGHDFAAEIELTRLLGAELGAEVEIELTPGSPARIGVRLPPHLRPGAEGETGVAALDGGAR